jgi:hypothetical protein
MLGSMLLIGLAGCAHQTPKPPPPQVEVFRVKDTPPAHLLTCPVRPVGFPLDAEATMPPAVRAAAIRLARAYDETVTQLERLIAFSSSPCPSAPDQGPPSR